MATGSVPSARPPCGIPRAHRFEGCRFPPPGSARSTPAVIAGLGLDLFDVARLEAEVRRRGPAEELNLFSPDELERCSTCRHPVRSLASCFAAKEALVKALSLEARDGWRWRDIEVTAVPGVAPTLALHGGLADLARQRGVARILLSLAGTRQLAIAAVVLEERS